MPSWMTSDLVEVLCRGSHLLPGLVEQLDADTEELLPGSVMSEEHGVVVITALAGYRTTTQRDDNQTVIYFTLPFN